jgi:hypothetical protein
VREKLIESDLFQKLLNVYSIRMTEREGAIGDRQIPPHPMKASHSLILLSSSPCRLFLDLFSLRFFSPFYSILLSFCELSIFSLFPP